MNVVLSPPQGSCLSQQTEIIAEKDKQLNAELWGSIPTDACTTQLYPRLGK